MRAPSPVELKAHFVDDIEEGQRLRGWITNAYAQIEFMLGDLILRATQFEQYSSLPPGLPHGAPDRVKRMRRILTTPGPLDVFADRLSEIMIEFENRHETRNLLAHGFCEYLYTPQGDAGLRFQKWHRQPNRNDARLVRTFRLADLRSERESFSALAQSALQLVVEIHAEFGWIERPTP